MKNRIGNGLPDSPIFVVGYPRSGTTLMQSLLASTSVSPPLLSFPETHYFNVLEKAIVSPDGLVSKAKLRSHRNLIRKTTGLTISYRKFRHLCKRAVIGDLDSRDLFEWIVVENIRKVEDASVWERRFRWVEKTPYHANYLSRIFHMYPESQCVFMIRHPVPAVMSRKRRFPFSRDFSINRLAHLWRMMGNNVAEVTDRFQGRVMTVKYEDLVSDPEGQIDELSRFLDVEMDSQRLESVPANARKMILASERWKRGNLRSGLRNGNSSYRETVSREAAARIEAAAAPVMGRLGYGPFFGPGQEEVNP